MNKSPKDRIIDIYTHQQQLHPSSALGIVHKTYEDRYVCDILVLDNNSTMNGSISTNVPLPMINGMSYSMPMVGDKVIVTFLGNDRNFPYIVAVYPATTFEIDSLSNVPPSILKHKNKIE